MKEYIIYEIPDVKIGATGRWPQRVKEQGYQPKDCNILFETDVLELASSMERVLQKKHGYPVDCVRFKTSHSPEANNNKARASAAIKADPIRNAVRSKNMSIASTKTQAAIKADPIRNTNRSKNMSEAAFLTQAAIKADPIRNTSKNKACSEAKKHKRIPVSQYTMDGVFIKEFVSQEAAKKATGINPGNISSARRDFNRSAGGFRWK